MISRPVAPWPSPYPWMDASTDPLRRMILERARMDVGALELEQNRGPEIDGYLRRAHVPESIIEAGRGYWCAAWAGCMWIDAGAKVPRDFGACDAWLPYLVPCSLAELPTKAQPGDAVLFGVPGDARHIEIVLRVSPRVLSIGGNRGLGGTKTNNGVAVHIDEVTRADVLGVVKPLRAV